MTASSHYTGKLSSVMLWTTALMITPTVGGWSHGMTLLWSIAFGLPLCLYVPTLRSRDIVINMIYVVAVAIIYSLLVSKGIVNAR